MNIHIWDLQGNKYDLAFPEKDVSLYSIQKKLLDDYQINTKTYYFCANSMILPSDAHLSPDFFQGEPQIIMYNSAIYPDKSYSRVDNAFNFNLSRYSDNFIQLKSQNSDINPPIPEELLQQIEDSGNGAFLFDILPLLVARNNLNRSRAGVNNDASSSSDEYDEVDDYEVSTEENNYNDRNFDDDDNEIENYNDDYHEEEDDSRPRFRFHVYNGNQNDNDNLNSRYLNHFEFGHRNDNDNENNYDDNYSDEENLIFDNRYMFNDQSLDPENEEEDQNLENEEEDQILENEEEDLLDDNEEENLQPNNRQRIQLVDDDGNIIHPNFNPILNFNNQYHAPNVDDENEDEAQNQNQNQNQRIEGLDVELTPVDQAAIRRLMNAGFDQMTAIQVYVACDRNEEAAFNVLVSFG